MTHPLFIHLIAPGHTHRSLDAGVVDKRLAHLRDAPKPQDLPHLRGLEALSRVSHALEPLTHRGDAVFGTLRRRGEPSDFGLCAPLYQASAKAGRATRPVVIRAFQPIASAFCRTLPPRLLGALNPDVQHAQAAAASLFSAVVGTLPGQLFGMGVMPICWTTSQGWAATKLAVLGSGYVAGFAVGQIEHSFRRVVGPAPPARVNGPPCNAITFALQAPIEEILPALRFVTHDGRHVFDVEELALWFQTSRTRRNVYTNAPFDAADDARLARYPIKGVSDHLYRALHRRWAHFELSDLLLLMQCAAVLVVAPNGKHIKTAALHFEDFMRRCSPAERGALDTLFSITDGTPLEEHLAACSGSERQRRAAGAQLYAALNAPLLMLMWGLLPAAVRGERDATQLLMGLLARDMAVHACLQVIDSAPLKASNDLLPVAELLGILRQQHISILPATNGV